MEQTKGLSCQIPESLHARVTAERVAANQSLSEYITGLLTNYYENGGKKDMAQIRTMAFQISEDLFQRIKDYLQRNNMTQRQFLIGLIEDELERDQTERESQSEAVSGDPDQDEDDPEQDEDAALDDPEADSDEDEDESEDDDQGFTMGM